MSTCSGRGRALPPRDRRASLPVPPEQAGDKHQDDCLGRARPKPPRRRAFSYFNRYGNVVRESRDISRNTEMIALPGCGRFSNVLGDDVVKLAVVDQQPAL